MASMGGMGGAEGRRSPDEDGAGDGERVHEAHDEVGGVVG